MKQIKKLGLVVVTLLLSATMAFAAKPNIHILATGGTIAGTGSSATGTSYTAGQVAIGALLDAVLMTMLGLNLPIKSTSY